MKVQVTRWGNSLGLRLPMALAAKVGLAEGSIVDLTEEEGRIVLAPARTVYALEDLLMGVTPQAMHDAFD